MSSNTNLKPTRANPGEKTLSSSEESLLEFCAKSLGHESEWNECRDQKALIITIHSPERIVKKKHRPFDPYAYDRDCYDLITELAIQVQHTKEHICVSRNDVLVSHIERYNIHNGNKQRTLRHAVVNLMKKVKNELGT